MGALLELQDLVVEARTQDGAWTRIVDGVSLRVGAGEVVGLIGESGAGKSTIGLACLAFARPGARFAGGRVLIEGANVLERDREGRRALRGPTVAYIAQSASAAFNPAMTLIDQVCEAPVRHGLATFGEARRQATDMFAKLGLPEPEQFCLRYPHQVSGGQLQRAMVAMAMACHPSLLVFDEPTTALDVTTQIEVLAAIKDLIRDVRTAGVYISHDLAVVAQISDRIMVLRYGRMVEEGPTRAIIEAPTQTYTRELVTARKEHPKPDTAGSAHLLLEVRGVTARYGAARGDVLEDVSIAVAPGRTVAVVGESGSGKSTLARVVTGLLPPRAGEVRLDGRVLPPRYARRDRGTLRRIQMIYQMPDVALNPRQTVAEAIGRPLALYLGMDGAKRRVRVAELLDQIGLPADFATRLPGELSGGQKQRVCIARALAAEPDLVICDEVTSALDPLIAEGILQLLQGLQDRLRLAFLFITHDLATVWNIADEVVVMRHGRVVEAGPKRTIFQPPHHPYTELLLSSAPEMRVDWLDGVLARRGGGGDASHLDKVTSKMGYQDRAASP
ncbi:MAG: ABC transporter ATP-binding protein [Alphaproteobacteria bacterium]